MAKLSDLIDLLKLAKVKVVSVCKDEIDTALKAGSGYTIGLDKDGVLIIKTD